MAVGVCGVMPVLGLGPAPCVVLLPFASPALYCVCCHSIVDLVVCFCDRVALLWDSGDGSCAGRNGGGAVGVWRLVLVHCSMSCLLSLLFPLIFVLVFGVVRAQPCEHARYPRTPLCSSVPCLVFSSPPRFSSPPVFLIVEWRWGFTMRRSIVLA